MIEKEEILMVRGGTWKGVAAVVWWGTVILNLGVFVGFAE